LNSHEAREAFAILAGYDTTGTGRVEWID